jgi:hypothetical protein
MGADRPTGARTYAALTEISKKYLEEQAKAAEKLVFNKVGAADVSRDWSNPASTPIEDVQKMIDDLKSQALSSRGNIPIIQPTAPPPMYSIGPQPSHVRVPLGQLATTISSEELNMLKESQLQMFDRLAVDCIATWDEASRTMTFTGPTETIVALRNYVDKPELLDEEIARRGRRKAVRVHGGIRARRGRETGVQAE